MAYICAKDIYRLAETADNPATTCQAVRRMELMLRELLGIHADPGCRLDAITEDGADIDELVGRVAPLVDEVYDLIQLLPVDTWTEGRKALAAAKK